MLSKLYKGFNVIVLEVKVTSSKLVDIVEYEYEKFRESLRENHIKEDLKSKMKHTITYSEWQECALKYDEMKGYRSYLKQKFAEIYFRNGGLERNSFTSLRLGVRIGSHKKSKKKQNRKPIQSRGASHSRTY